MAFHHFCLVLAAIGTPTYKLAKFFVSMLEPMTVSKYNIKDVFSFAEELLTYGTKFRMTVFGVKLFF